MTRLDTEMAAEVVRMLAEVGVEATLRTHATTAAGLKGTATDTAVTMTPLYDDEDEGDKRTAKTYVGPLTVTPATGDYLIYQGETWTIVKIEADRPGDTIVGRTFHLVKGGGS